MTPESPNPSGPPASLHISEARPADADLLSLAEEIGGALSSRSAILTTAESCTGGLVAKLVTDIAGSSEWFDRAFITYSNEAKEQMLGVPASLLAQHGAVSREVVLSMVSGALGRSRSTIGVSLSGIAGPGGATPGKPVGTVWIGWGMQDSAQSMLAPEAQCFQFDGDRDTVRRLAAVYALRGIIDRLGTE